VEASKLLLANRGRSAPNVTDVRNQSSVSDGDTCTRRCQ
jgi:hypothetical protein